MGELVIVVAGATLYDRLRHLFFMVPPLCLLVGFGLYICFSSLERGSGLREKALAFVDQLAKRDITTFFN